MGSLPWAKYSDRHPPTEGMGLHSRIAPFHPPHHHYYVVVLSIQTNNSVFHISSPSSSDKRLSTSRRKQGLRKLVAENNGGTSEKEQGKTITSTETTNGGFWSNFRIRQKKPSRIEKNGKPDLFWNSFFSGNDGDLQDMGPVQIGLLDLLDPDPQNMLTVAFICLLTLAAFQILWQLFFVSLAIVVAALKYSLIAAILLFIIVTLL